MANNPHDVLFRWAFADLQRTAGLLRAVLPPGLVAMVQWDAGEIVPIELLDKDLFEKRTDLIRRYPLYGRRRRLYIIFEHQSSCDRLMGLRFLDYARLLWIKWCADNPRWRFLPPVTAVVVSHDPGGWTAPTNLLDLHETDSHLDSQLGANRPDMGFIVEDLQRREDAVITGWELDAIGKLTLLHLKHIRRCPDVGEQLRVWKPWFEQAEPWEEVLPRFVCYIMSNRKVKDEELRQVFAEMLGRRAGDIVMTEAERLMAEGEKRGRREGRQEGSLALFVRFCRRRLGRDITNAERAVLTTRWVRIDQDQVDALFDLSSEQLEAWLTDPQAK